MLVDTTEEGRSSSGLNAEHPRANRTWMPPDRYLGLDGKDLGSIHKKKGRMDL